jgi:surfeit locus 1 family protein
VRYQFKPGLLISLVTLLFVFVLLALGFWQLDRANQKETIQRQFMNRYTGKPVNLNKNTPERIKKDQMQWRKSVIDGNYSTDYIFLLDNQVMDSQVGYFVYTPFKLAAESVWVLINRGWVKAGPRREESPLIKTPGARIKVNGVIKPPPRTGLKLGQAGMEKITGTTYRVQHLDIDQIAEHTNLELLPYIVRLDLNDAYGFKREWRLPGSGKEKHLGYAFQWFALAIALLIIYFVVNLKKRDEV